MLVLVVVKYCLACLPPFLPTSISHLCPSLPACLHPLPTSPLPLSPYTHLEYGKEGGLSHLDFLDLLPTSFSISYLYSPLPVSLPTCLPPFLSVSYLPLFLFISLPILPSCLPLSFSISYLSPFLFISSPAYLPVFLTFHPFFVSLHIYFLPYLLSCLPPSLPFPLLVSLLPCFPICADGEG